MILHGDVGGEDLGIQDKSKTSVLLPVMMLGKTRQENPQLGLKVDAFPC